MSLEMDHCASNNLLDSDASRTFRNLVEKMGTAVFLADEHDKIFYYNPALKRFWGQDKARYLLSGNWLHLMFPDPLQRVKVKKQLFSTGYIKDFELKFVHADQVFVVLFSANLIRNGNQKFIGVRGDLVDITQRHLLENALRQEHEKTEQILSLCNALSEFCNDSELSDHIVEQTASILQADRCSLMFIDAAQQELFIKAAVGIKQSIRHVARIKLGHPVCGLIAQHGKPVLIENIESNNVIQQPNNPLYGSPSFVSSPVIIGKKVVGLLNVSGRNKPFTGFDLKIVETIALQTSINMNKLQTFNSLETLSQTDGMTGLLNFRSFSQKLDEEIHRVQRYGNKLSLVMVDADNFKHFNDTKGHQAGDNLLRRLADILRSSLRKTDVVCRYGGDEFAVILPETDAHDTFTAFEKIRVAVEEEFFNAHITLSIGIAQFVSFDTSEMLLKKTDQALYVSKNAGRNRISLSS